ncbi:PfkB family carbohydrate kinase [Arabiibacter massiliensis]|uniref:PfkB family carbohydrate kinase n=1 Tax=Arabiibacter massiliensis TaxID=1870985 RepID=UPI0009B99ED6|nr:PfkB family carbohydrate kinase [Arabiibacter massiliensis]
MSNGGDAILAVGAIIVDLVCRVPRLPQSGEGIVADEVRATVGGCAFNSANVLRQLGVPHTLFAPVGSGVFAGFAERELAARGLEALRVPGGRDNGGCVCFVEPDGQRTMLTMPGIDRHFEPAWFDALDAGRFACGLASGYEVEGAGGSAIIGFFEAHPQVQLYYGPGPRIQGVGPEKTARINALHPVWHLNDQEALAYTGRASLEAAGFALAEECGNAVVVTAGAEGAHLFEGGRHVLVPTEPVRVVDTIGAGDAHLGALVAARTAGRSWEDALALANRVAGAVCQVEGGTLDDETFAQLGVPPLSS